MSGELWKVHSSDNKTFDPSKRLEKAMQTGNKIEFSKIVRKTKQPALRRMSCETKMTTSRIYYKGEYSRLRAKQKRTKT